MARRTLCTVQREHTTEHHKGKCVTNFTLLNALVYESHEGTLNCTTATGSSSLLPPLPETAVNGLSAVSANSTSHINMGCSYVFICLASLSDPQMYGYFFLGMLENTPKISPQNMLQYRNVFNDRARMNFCYWLVERKGTKCKY